MQILYEPVAVRRKKVFFLPAAAKQGKAIGEHPREGEKICAAVEIPEQPNPKAGFCRNASAIVMPGE